VEFIKNDDHKVTNKKSAQDVTGCTALLRQQQRTKV
jgi:hypothetical protein